MTFDRPVAKKLAASFLKVYSKDLHTANIVSMKENISRSFLGPLITVHRRLGFGLRNHHRDQRLCEQIKPSQRAKSSAHKAQD